MTSSAQYLGIASRQHGLITLRQLVDLGVTRRHRSTLLMRGVLARTLPGIFLVRGSPSSWEQRVLAATLWAGERAAASHETAAALWGLDGFPKRVVHVSSPANLKAPRDAPFIAHSRWKLGRTDVHRVGRIPTTSVERTLIDLSATHPALPVEKALDHALTRRLIRADTLMHRLRELTSKGRPGIGEFRAMVEKRLVGFHGDSTLENDYLRLLRKAGLPTGIPQYEVRDRRGTLISRVDFAYPEHAVVVLCDGYEWHGGRRRRDKDSDIWNRLQDMGHRVLHVTYADVHEHPERLLRRLRAWVGTAELLVRDGDLEYALAA